MVAQCCARGGKYLISSRLLLAVSRLSTGDRLIGPNQIGNYVRLLALVGLGRSHFVKMLSVELFFYFFFYYHLSSARQVNSTQIELSQAAFSSKERENELFAKEL